MSHPPSHVRQGLSILRWCHGSAGRSASGARQTRANFPCVSAPVCPRPVFRRPLLWSIPLLVSLFIMIIAMSGCERGERAESVSVEQRVESLRRQRQQLDRTLWSQEELAQDYGRAIVRLWDELKAGDAKLEVLSAAPFDRLTLGRAVQRRELDHGLRVVEYAGVDQPAPPSSSYNPQEWRDALAELRARGYRLEMTDWHHEAFEVDPPRSKFSVNLYARRPDHRRRLHIHATLRVKWSQQPEHDPGRPDGRPHAQSVVLEEARIIERTGGPFFEEAFRVDPPGRQGGQLEPLLLYDLNGDGPSEVILAGSNRVLWNRADRLVSAPLLEHPAPMQRAAILADFTGDGHADFICAGYGPRDQGVLLLYRGDAEGRFPARPTTISTDAHRLQNVVSLTAGDIDGDHDLDLWAAQYKPPYVRGQMPTPYYDANDGYPSYLFRNDGGGRFTDITEQAGLAAKRFRRTWSSSLVDLDDDGDPDLITVNDFAGIDLYHNDGTGRFTDVSETLPDRHNFGMSHTFDDFNGDGRMDVYTIGMSSPAARRLERMGLGRPDFPEHNRMRMRMAYGNRMYYGRPGGGFSIPPFNDRIARTGWSWGSSSFDFDNDGDADIYVGNGHVSAKSTADYCTTFWRHDIYTGDSEPDRAVNQLLNRYSLGDLYAGEQSWDGYQKNVLFMNRGGGFINVAYPLGVGFQYDTRSVVSDDLDTDGRMDLLFVQRKRTEEGQRLHVIKNKGPVGRWIGVRLREHGDGFSPVGAEIILHTTGGTRSKRLTTGDSITSQHANIAHFGLGDKSDVQRIEVRWPNGEVSRIEQPRINRYYDVRPRHKAASR